MEGWILLKRHLDPTSNYGYYTLPLKFLLPFTDIVLNEDFDQGVRQDSLFGIGKQYSL